MDERLALQLAGRIHALLLHDLLHGVDAARMLTDPLYTRDVLLVCDAYRGSTVPELAALSQAFRDAVAEPAPPALNGSSRHGFAASQPGGPDRHGAQQADARRDPRPLAPDAERQRSRAEGQRRNGAQRQGQPPGSQPANAAKPHSGPGRSKKGNAQDRGASDSRGNGFSASRFLGSLFGPPLPLDATPAPAASKPPRSWFGRSRPADRDTDPSE